MMIPVQECYKNFPCFGYLRRFVFERGFGFVSSQGGKELFAHITARIPRGFKIKEVDIGEPCLFIRGRALKDRKDAAVSWCLLSDVDWGLESPCINEIEYSKRRKRLFSTLNKTQILQLLTDRPAKLRDLDDPMLETLVRDHLRRFPVNSQGLSKITEALLDSPFRFAPSLIKAASLLNSGDCYFGEDELALLLSVFSPHQLASGTPPDPLFLSLASKDQLPHLLEWALRTEHRPTGWNIILDSDLSCEQHVATRLLADDDCRFDSLATRWIKRQLERGVVEPDSLLERMGRHPGEERQWIDFIPDTHRALWFARRGQLNELIELSSNSTKTAVLNITMESLAIAVDLETNGEEIWQIAVAAGDSSETLYDRKKDGDGTLQEALNTLKERLFSRKLWVGHNILAWDIPILQKYIPRLDEIPLVWDTLLISYLMAPWQESHSLGGTHEAAVDAKAAYLLFKKQAHQLGIRSVIDFIRKPPTNGAGLIGAVADLLDDKPFQPPAPPPWFAVLRENYLRPQQRQRIVIPHALLHQAAWIKDAAVFLPDTDATSEIDHRVIDNKRFSEAAALSKLSNPHVSVLANILRRAEQSSIRVQWGMIPPWLKEVPAVKECLLNSSVINNAGNITFSAFPRTTNWYVSDEAQDAIFLFPPRAGLVTDISWNAGVDLPQRISQELDKELPKVPTLYRINGNSNENQNAQWIFFDPIRQYLNRAGQCYRTFRTTPFSLLPRERIVGLTYAKEQPVLVEWGNRTYLYPTAGDQRSYWSDVLERMKSIAMANPETVLLLLIVSSDELKLRELLEDALVALKLAHERQRHWSRLERLRRAAAHKGKRCIVDFVDCLPEWSRLAYSSGIGITPVIEAIPLPEWKALMDSALNEEELENAAGMDVDDDDPSDLTAYGHQHQRNYLQRAPLTVTVPDIKILMDSCLDDWLLSIGCDESFAPWIIDPRLPPRILRQHFRSIALPPISLTEDERELAEIALDDIGAIERQVPEDDYESLRNFLQSHWNYPDFHNPTQKPAIEAIRTRNQDVLVILPTGAGKSVLFQVPALYRGLKTRRLTIVISPLRALMKDQVFALNNKGFQQSVDYLSADRPAHELEDVYQGILDHRIVLLYVAPERFRNRRFLDLLDRRFQRDDGFEFIVIDETHCVVQWGYEFRPDYFHALEIIRTRYRKSEASEKTPFLLFSATVPANVQDSLEKLIRGDGSEPYLPFTVINPSNYASPIRSPIHIKTEPVLGTLAGRNPRDWDLETRLEVIAAQINKAAEVRRETGQISGVIVFVSRRIQAEEIALRLADKALGSVAYFHAGLDPETREDVYTRYKDGHIDILVATKAFGMGMDIPHIHWAIHLSPPSYLEDYLQEVGRIGRGEEERKQAGLDRLTSMLLHSPDDFQANHTNMQRSRIDFPQLKDLWNQIRKHAQPREDGWIALMPDSGFYQHPTSWEIDRAVNRIRNSLFWLEKMGRITIIQMVPGLLPMTLFPTRLEQLSGEGNGDTARIAECLFKLANGNQRTTLEKTAKPGHSSAISSNSKKEGWVDRIISSISNFFGFVLGGKETGSDPKLRIIPEEGTTERKTHSPSHELEVVVNMEQVWKETSYRSSFEVLVELAKLQELGGLKITRKLSFSQSELGKKLNTAQIEGLMAEVEKVASNLISRMDSRQYVKLDFEAADLSFQVTDPQGKLIEVRHIIEKSTALVLRLAGARVKEETPEGRNQSVQIATLSAGKAGGAIQRCRSLIQLTRKIWEQIQSPLADGKSDIELETLVRITVDVQARFHERGLRQALHLLASLKLALCSEPLVPLSYVLEVIGKDTPLNEQNDPEVLGELRQVNRLAEIRSHAMEVYANVPEQAQEGFIAGYFKARGADDLEAFLEEQLREIEAESGSSFVQQKLAQIRKEEIGKLFQRYRDPRAPEPNQWRVIHHPYYQHLLVNAGPGAGKTSVLIARVAHLIHEQHLKPEQILVLAFNRAVVFEIRSKIKKLFHDLGYGAYVRSLRVYTFHALATRYLGRVDKDENRLLARFAELLENDAPIAREAAEGIRAIMVDEFQDVDEHIFKIIEIFQKQSGAGVLAIGDDDQDILRWNRINNRESGERTSATWYFQEIEKLLNLNQESRLALQVNFRSGSAIIQQSERLLDKFFGQEAAEKRLKHEIALKPSADNLEAQVDDQKDPQPWDWALSKARELLKEAAGRSGTVAILCRTNGEVAQVYNQLKKEFPELKLQTSNAYRLSSLRHMACWVDLCQKFLNSESDPLLDGSVRAKLEKAWGDLIIPEVSTPNSDDISPWDVWELIRQERNYPRISDLIDFIEHTETDEFFRIIGKVGNSGSTVISTIHKVKGLEFDAVVLFPSQSGFPLERHEQDLSGAAAEEARLFYVGMTRAKCRLVFGFGKREKAWWKKSPQENLFEDNHKVLRGSPNEVWISWSATPKYGGGQELQQYIEQQIAIGDSIEARGQNLWHSKTKRQVGVLSNNVRHSGSSKLRVAAVLRYPQSPNDQYFLEKPWAFDDLAPEVRQRGWSYVVLVSGVLSGSV